MGTAVTAKASVKEETEKEAKVRMATKEQEKAHKQVVGTVEELITLPIAQTRGKAMAT
jgi:hypothetical protein